MERCSWCKQSFYVECCCRRSSWPSSFRFAGQRRSSLLSNDLQGLYPEDDRIVFYPASYKVPYKLEETDNANVVGRAEALDKITKSPNSWIVTYPKALFERVPTKQKLSTNSFKIEKRSEER